MTMRSTAGGTPAACHATNGSNVWMTPRDFLCNLVDSLDLAMPLLDVAAGSLAESVAPYFIDETRDSLNPNVSWRHLPTDEASVPFGGVRWANPPYGRTCAVCADKVWKTASTKKATGVTRKSQFCPNRGHWSRDISAWMAKAATEGTDLDGGPLLVLIPARIGADWWQSFVVNKAARVWFVNGRIKFVDANGESAKCGAGFDAAVVEYRGPGYVTQYGYVTREGKQLQHVDPVLGRGPA